MGQDTVNDGDAAPATNTKSLYGGISYFVSVVATFPLYKIVYRQQLEHIRIREAVAQLYGEGLRKLYRGVTPPLIVRTLQGSVLFSVQGKLYHRSTDLVPEHIPRPLLQAAAGVGTGVVEALLFTPFERVQNVLQNRRNEHRLRTHLVQLSSEPLSLGFYRAFLPIMARNALGSGLYFGLKNPVRDFLGQQGISPTTSSFTSGAVISLFLYPLSVLVANMQAGVGQEDARGGLKNSARKLWAESQKSVTLLFRGGFLVILRSCIGWGIITAIFDTLDRGSSG